MPIEIKDFRAYEKNTLKGFLTVEFTTGLQIRDICLHEKDGGSRWLSMPAKPYEKDGETSWIPIVRFPDRELWRQFQESVLAALDEYKTKNDEIPLDVQ